MRPLRLARVAAQAEILVVRRQMAGYARRAIWAAAAVLFAVGVLIMAHIIAYLALRQYAGLAAIPAVAIVLAADLVIAVIFAVLAAGSTPDPILDDAIRLRDQSLDQARQSLTLAALVAPLTRIAAETGLIRMLLRLVSRGFRKKPVG